MITIMDYGVGNIKAFGHACKDLGISCRIAQDAAAIMDAERIILPGVGSFDHAMSMLNRSGMLPALKTMVLERKAKVLGVCVGMQMLAHTSDEGSMPGLGWIDAQVKKFPADGNAPVRLPHMGWNDMQATGAHPLLTGLDDARFYFLHSYYFACNDKEDTLAQTSYVGRHFSSVVGRDNIYGVQFHPEKSHQYGLRLLKNFSVI